jgi:hypothetical protein
MTPLLAEFDEFDVLDLAECTSVRQAGGTTVDDTEARNSFKPSSLNPLFALDVAGSRAASR